MVKVSLSCYCHRVTVVTIVPDDFDDCNCPDENCLRGRNRQYNVHTRTFTTPHTHLRTKQKYNLSHCAETSLLVTTISENFIRKSGMNDVCLQDRVLSYK